ncbi:uncharacterized protein LOC128189905 isoform X1 [Crassostrea angulata]|uniref:uncharacterized protein LOC128189905 isoform X1 n=1 Tax=Magallana angulata TaxID=2784310 RepID=UPI0022B0FCA2|nr:uncharacterized protein LOC128189905 isoform X1 [Crassostrea angulata]
MDKQRIKIKMEFKMISDYSLLNSNNFDICLAPRVGKLTEVFSRHLDALDDDTTVTIVDFGTNDGRNIFPFMKIMIEQIQRRLKTCDINIVLNDQPTNDFNELAKNAEAFQREMNDQCLHVMINPGNAYRRCLPRSSIDLGTCTLMVQWLSTSVKLKNLLLYSPDHMVSDHEKSEITCLAAQDWKSFIQSRSKEMKTGAIMHVSIPTGWKNFFQICSSTFHQLLERNVISKEELQNTTIPNYPFRSETDIKAPFEDIGEEIDVKLLDVSTRKLRFYENKDIADCARSWIYHGMVAGLCQTRNNEEANDICEAFFDDLKVQLLGRKWIDCEMFDVIFQKI